MDNNTVSVMIRARLATRGQSQVQAATEIGVSQARFGRWLRGEYPSADNMAALAGWLSVPEGDLVGQVHAEKRRRSTPDLLVRLDVLEGRLRSVERFVAEARVPAGRRG